MQPDSLPLLRVITLSATLGLALCVPQAEAHGGGGHGHGHAHPSRRYGYGTGYPPGWRQNLNSSNLYPPPILNPGDLPAARLQRYVDHLLHRPR